MVLPSYIERFIKVQEILQLRNRVELPQIVVVGRQGSGKSSVLECIIGHDVLPKGDGLVVRCPIVINLKQMNVDADTDTDVNTDVNTGVENEYAIFGGTNDKIAICDIKEQIIAHVNELCGDGREIRDRPIYLNIFLKKTVNIALVDLPGLINASADSQSKKIIDEMNIKFCKNSNSLILAVIDGCVDLVNPVSLKIARIADPDLKRTMGVITKVDLVDDRSSIHTMLENKEVRPGHGYVGVINRNMESISMDEHARREKVFFRKYFSSAYPNIGSEYLVRKVYSTFRERIRVFMGDLAYMLETEMSKLQDMRRNGTAYTYRLIDEYTQFMYSQLTNKCMSLDAYACFKDLNVKIRASNVFQCEAGSNHYIRKKTEHIYTQALNRAEHVYADIVQYIERVANDECRNEEESNDNLFDRFSVLKFIGKDHSRSSDIVEDKSLFISLNNKLRSRIISILNKAAISLLSVQKAKLVDSMKQHFKIQQSCIDRPGRDKENFFVNTLRWYERNADTVRYRGVSNISSGMTVMLMKMHVNSYCAIARKELGSYFVKVVYYHFVEFFRVDFKVLLLTRLNDFKLIYDDEIHERMKKDMVLLDVIKDQ